MSSERLRFTTGNQYLPKDVYSFSLPSGYTCPGASACLTFVGRETGKFQMGKAAQYRCYSANAERFPCVRKVCWGNFDLLRAAKTTEAMTRLILDSIPPKAKKIRVHTGGDLYSQDYFDSWMDAARHRPDITFWAFTKSLPFWLHSRSAVPSNFCLQASDGGKHDALIADHKLKFARVVFSETEAKEAGLEFDHDDSHAMSGDASFALALHGEQTPGTEAAAAANRLKALHLANRQPKSR